MNTLLCDLGGTNCRLGFAVDGSVVEQSIRQFKNAFFTTFLDLLKHYLDCESASVPGAVLIALAAPVDGDSIALTNLDWTIDRSEIAHLTGSNNVHFINDFEALGHALAHPQMLTTMTVQEGVVVEQGQRLVLGAGTGFNCALYLSEGSVVKCEAGHSSFAAVTEFDHELKSKMSIQYGRCSVERVLSGSGYCEIYASLAGLDSRQLDGIALMRAGLEGCNEIAGQANQEFARILGQVAGDLALLYWARGGIWLFGGPTLALGPLLSDPEGVFLKEFRAKGRMNSEMENVPIELVLENTLALRGCLQWARKAAG